LKKLILFAAPAVVLALSAMARADHLIAKPGLWKITVTQSMAGQSMPPRTVTNCITQQKIDDAEHTFGNNAQFQAQGCKRTSYQQTTNSIAMKVECSGQMKANIDMSMKFDSPTHMSGTSKITGDMGVMTSSTVGDRIGDCTGKEADSE
jgi:hypothetical protein